MRLLLGGVVLAGVGVFYVADQFDKHTNYDHVMARVRSVNETCYMEKRGYKSKTTSDVLPCAVAETLVKTHPAWEGFSVKYKIELSLAYVSPVDGSTQTGSLTISRYPDAKRLKSGDVFEVLASKEDAKKIRSV